MPSLKAIVANALAEDVGRGDITSEVTIPASARSTGVIVARQHAVVSGLPVAREVFLQMGGVTWKGLARDGDRVRPGQVVASIRGRTRSILTGERVALNFIQRLSGVATLTRRFVDAVKGTGAMILDTRKTTPGLRALEKWAVLAGGGWNHRRSLNEAVLIKDNHLAARPPLADVIRALLKRRLPLGICIEIEAQSRAQALAFAELEIDVLMLDNMSVKQMRALVREIRKIRPKLLIEASGGVTLETVRAVAKTGVDWISVGALTHSAPAVDFSLDLR